MSGTAAVGPVKEWQESVALLREPRYSQSLERGLAILECFTSERPLVGIAELADRLGMSRSTTHRYVITLVELGYLCQGAHRKYHLGLRVTDLGMSALNSTGLREHSRPYIEELSRRSSCAIAVAVLDGDQILYVDRVSSPRHRRRQGDLELAAGSRLPVYCTAMGKLLMSQLPERERSQLVARLQLSRRGPGTITSKRTLREELAQIAAEGFAVNNQELAAGLHAIAAPLRSEAHEAVAAVSLAAHGSTVPLDGLVGHLAPHLIATADSISARLGYRRADERSSVWERRETAQEQAHDPSL